MITLGGARRAYVFVPVFEGGLQPRVYESLKLTRQLGSQRAYNRASKRGPARFVQSLLRCSLGPMDGLAFSGNK